MNLLIRHQVPANTLVSSCSALDDCISDNFDQFGMDGMPDFVQNGVIDSATDMLGYVSDKMAMVDSGISAAARLMQGDISVLLPPPSSGKGFVDQLQAMWRSGNRLSGNASDLFTMIKNFSGISMGSDLAPRGVWKTDSKTTQSQKQQSNYVASAVRTTAISEAAYAVTTLPAPVVTTSEQSQQSTGWPSVTHPELNNAPDEATVVDVPAWDDLVDIRDTLNTAIDKELSRTTDDRLFLALRRVKSDLNNDIKHRLIQTQKTVIRTPDEVTPALVLAATWFDNASRESDIVRRNAVAHPGFVPVAPLRVPVR